MQWMNVDDTKPEDGKEYLVWYDGHIVYGKYIGKYPEGHAFGLYKFGFTTDVFWYMLRPADPPTYPFSHIGNTVYHKGKYVMDLYVRQGSIAEIVERLNTVINTN